MDTTDSRDELTTVATFTNTPEAELAKERLEMEGVRAFVVGVVTAHLMPYLAGSVALQVGTPDAAQALEILALPPLKEPTSA